MNKPLRVAILGAGIFAQRAHIPAMLNHNDKYKIVAIYSRTQASAQACADKIPYSVEVSTNADALFQRDDIDVYDILLPIEIMPDYVTKALATGKHVISEKPIAPTVAIGLRLLSQKRSNQQWMVAENFRYEEIFWLAKDKIEQGVIGKPLLASSLINIPMNPDNRYYVTKWRQKAQFPGGWLMDAGVHHVAELRLILGEITQVQAQATLFREDLPPYDTMTATLNFESGVLGNYSATYATNVDYRMYLDITGEDGYMIVTPDSLEIFPNEGDSQRFEKQGGFSVAEEFKAFADAILEGEAHRNSAQEGLQDVAVMEALLTSIENGHMVYVPQFVYGL